MERRSGADDGSMWSIRSARLEAFSDGVFAIATTLLVLEIAVPEDAGDDLLDAFVDQWPSYLAYVVSFTTIGAVWLAHSAITHFVHAVDSVLARLNLLLLLLVAFLPFPTGLVGRHIRDHDAERVATTILGINLLLVAMVVSTMWQYAVHRGLVRPDANDEEVRLLTRRLTPSIASYVVVILVGLVAPRVAVFGYLVIAIALVVPTGFRRAMREPPPADGAASS